jgi:F-type H+-transporting ATPase subunit delta
MYGSSKKSMAALHDSLADRQGDAGLSQVSADLLAVAALLARSTTLRSTLCDGGIVSAAKRGIVDQLLSTQLSPAGLSIVQDVVASRWSHDHDIVEALETLGAQAAFIEAQRHGSLDQVEDELFRFGRALEASDELQLTMTDPSLSGEAKAGIVRDLMAGGSPVTISLLSFLVSHLQGRAPIAAVENLNSLAAAQRGQVLAEISTAVALTSDQQTRMASVLSRLTGRQVHLNIEVVPEVIGGIVVRIGDEVIDGSVSARLEQARRALVG